MGQFQSNPAEGPIAEALASLSIEANTDQVRLLGGYVGELSLWGRRTNLTGNPSIEAIINGPLWDALTLIPVLREDGSLIDVGSGGGLPGIPAAILRPRMRVTLVEPRTKRGTFLRHAVHTLGLEADVIESRVENLEVPPFDGAVAQAVWPPEEWIKRAKLLVRPGGAIYVLSSSPLAGSDLTDEVRPEEEAHLVRPRDGARRSATRLTRA